VLRLLTIATLLATVAVAHAADLSPRVRLVTDGHLPAAAIGDALPDGRAVVLLRLADATTAERLRAAGLDVRAVSPTVAVARASSDDLRRLATTDGVIDIEERRILRPTLDRAAQMVGAPTARASTGLTGRGVLVGILDTGIDATHPDVRTADGKTRLHAVLDFGQAENDAPNAPPGRLFRRDAVDAALATFSMTGERTGPLLARDRNGHGTHVATIAAGNGLATDKGLPAERYVGIAPGADLLALRATREIATFYDSDVVTAARVAVELADETGRPLVVNMSLGGAGGPGDGTTDLESALAELFPAGAEGRALVIAAGNDGDADVRAAGLGLDGEIVVPLELRTSAAARGAATIELFYDGELTLVVESPDGRRTGPVATGKNLSGTAGPLGRAVVDNTAIRGALRRATVVIEPTAGNESEGELRWKLVLAGRARRWDATILEWPSASPMPKILDHVSVDHRLAIPAATATAISVGSVVSRTEWVNVDGTTITRPIVVGRPSIFTASGPTTDGRFAPDVAAPGELVIAALSSDAPPTEPTSAFFVGENSTYAVADDGRHGVLRGTSQAAPVVAGAIALLFEANPRLTGRDVREILRVAARPLAVSPEAPVDAGATSPPPGWSTRTGFGLLDVATAVALARGTRGGPADPSTSTVGLSRDALPPDEITLVTVVPRDAAGLPIGAGAEVTIEASAGLPIGPVVDAGWGRYERTFVAAAPRGTVAEVQVTVNGVALASRPHIFVVEDRSEIGRPFRAAGGCQTTPRAPAAAALTVAALALALLVQRKFARRRKPDHTDEA
jgi:uncharacterized protein (TIGR03382 family)